MRYLRLWLVVVGLAGLIVGFLVGARVRLWPWRADWFEATGVWVSAALSAAILVWLALRSEKLAQAQAEEQARHEADLIECAAVVAQGDKVEPGEPGVVLVRQIVFSAHNFSDHTITGVSCRVPLHGIGLIKMPDATRRRQSTEQIRVAEPFKADDNLREVNENAEFRFSLDGHAWSKKPGEPAQSLKSPNKL